MTGTNRRLLFRETKEIGRSIWSTQSYQKAVKKPVERILKKGRKYSQSVRAKANKSYKSSIKSRFNATYKYHQKRITRATTAIKSSRYINPSDRRRLTGMLDDIALAFKKVKETAHNLSEIQYQDMRERLSDVSEFLRKLASVGWNIGAYVKKYGFHDEFVPEDYFEWTSDIAKAIELAYDRILEKK